MNNNKRKTKRRKLLFQAGILVAAMFLLTAVINGIFIYYSSSHNYIEMLENHTGNVLIHTKSSMEKYSSLQ